MSDKVVKVLVVDDHPLIIQGLKSAINNLCVISCNRDFIVESAVSILDAVKLINKRRKIGLGYDLVFLDIRLPHCNVTRMQSGEDLGAYIRDKMPESKIVVITSLRDSLRLTNIIAKINPNGVLIKSDLDGDLLQLAVKEVLSGRYYYSEEMMSLLNKKITSDQILDEFDILLLKELANGSKMKELQEILPLTKSGIDKRKRMLRFKFQIQDGSDRDLVLIARAKGFI